MNGSVRIRRTARLLRRAAGGACAAALLAVATPLVAGATSAPTADQAPTIGTITATGGDVTVTWTNDASDATSIDVILYDQNGDVLIDDNVAPTATSDTFTDVADGGGYTIDVIANTPGGALDPGGSSPFDIYQGSYVVDQAPTIGTITATGGDVTVTWTNDAPDATSIDVILYDQNGDVLVDDNVAPTSTSDTFTDVADGGGYTIDVIANTPSGPLDPGGSNSFDIYQGSYVVDQPPTIGTISATGGDVTVTWTNDAADATSIDVILYDQNGDVLVDDNVAPTATSDTFTDVADGGGYTIDVIANTPGGALDPGSSATFDIYQGSYVVDQAPTIGTITATGGDVAVTWTNDAPDATSIDVILYDQNGDVLVDDNVAPTATSDTFTDVADGQGYTIDVIANTPGGSLDPGSSAPFDLSGGSLSLDAAATIQSLSATGGVVTITWTSNTPDATSFDVILYASDGTVIEDDSVSATTTTDSFQPVADGSGYSVAIVAHTPIGDFTSTSGDFDLVNGSIAVVPIDHPTPAPIPVPAADVTVTPIDGGAGGWTVSWTELAGAPTDGYYLVTDDQGDSCTAQPTGVAGTLLSCTLAARADGSTDISGVTVEFVSGELWFGMANGTGAKATSTGSAVTATATGTSTSTATTTPDHGSTPTVVHAVAAGPLRTGASALPLVLAGVGALVLALAALVLRRRRRIL